MKKNRKNLTFAIVSAAVIVIISAAILWGVHAIGGIGMFVDKITEVSRDHIMVGLIMFLVLQILQIIISVIPGEPLEVMSGMLYGTLGGFFWCTLGIIIGSILIFFFVRKYGIKFISRFIDPEELFNYQFMKESTKLETIIFILFLIPGTPKDVLIYVAALSRIKLSDFLIITSFARIPSIITSTYAGSSLGQGNIINAVWAFVIIAVIGIAGIYIHPKIMNRLKKARK